jgi:hypothetical protein
MKWFRPAAKKDPPKRILPSRKREFRAFLLSLDETDVEESGSAASAIAPVHGLSLATKWCSNAIQNCSFRLLASGEL